MAHKIIASTLSALLLSGLASLAHAQVCTPAQECGDVNGVEGVTVADALGVLRRSIGLSVDLSCSCMGGDSCPIGGLVETGQTQCWDPLDTVSPINPIDCPGTGQDGEIRAGVSASLVDNGDGTVTDTHTTLMWEKLSDDGDPLHDFDNATYQWAGAYQKILQLNNAAFAGHNDWRLPNVKELATLIDFSSTNANGAPSITSALQNNCKAGCTILNCACTKSNAYWSSTTQQSTPASAWYVQFQNGSMNPGGKTTYYYVRAVRGGY
jgi:hypothetical protein